MKAGLLICDHVLPELIHIQGEYLDMFQKLLPGLDLIPYYVCDGEFPEEVNDMELYICTGSRYSVYDDIPWIQKLANFVKDIYHSGTLFVGVCFGHQMMAHALGGKVEKAKSGWSIGVHQFEIIDPLPWMLPSEKDINLLMMCQDQVLKLPPEGQVIAKTATCPVGMFTIGEHFLGVQAHPEYSKAYNQELYNLRRKLIGINTIEKANATLNLPLNRDTVANWIMNFVSQAFNPGLLRPAP
ncbi:MAG: amidotransferase [Bacteroidetes bacterium]|nr:amidotransferase [Bacteroidota bacterium]MDA1120797.1 amidotransferase [Bacteroidota bacterium]